MNAQIIPIAALQLSERDFQKVVIREAEARGWMAYSIPDSRMATLKGFPDLVLIKEPEVLFAELKTQKGRLSQEQKDVLEQLNNSDMETHVWRPSDLHKIIERLSNENN